MKTYLICGLGNPGQEYEKTRHNVGFMAIDQLQQQGEYSSFKEEKKFQALVAQKSEAEIKTLLVKPLTFMNNSGIALQSLQNYYKIPVENILIIYDDVDLPVGTIRIRKQGGPGTHNGMKSLITHLGSNEFPRIRIGIAPLKEDKRDLRDFVLGQFNEEERPIITDKVLKLMPSIIDTYLKKEIEVAMNKFNNI